MNTSSFGRNDAAKYLNVSASTFDRIVKAGVITADSHAPGGRNRYEKQTLDKAAEKTGMF